MRAIAIVDGEHYAAVVRHALAELPYDFAAAVLIGGQEKLRGGEEYGVPLAADVESAIASHAPDVVVDLSDEPVLGPPERLALASRVLGVRRPVRRGGLPVRSAGAGALRDALDRRRGNREARREDGSDRTPRETALGRPRAWSSSRWGEAGRPSPR